MCRTDEEQPLEELQELLLIDTWEEALVEVIFRSFCFHSKKAAVKWYKISSDVM